MTIHGCGANGSIVLEVKSCRAESPAHVLLRKVFQCLADQAKRNPILERHRAETFVELDRRRVPVEHRPFEASASALLRQAGEMCEQRLADSAAAHLRIDEKIFEIDSRLAEECGVVMEEEGESHFDAVH